MSDEVYVPTRERDLFSVADVQHLFRVATEISSSDILADERLETFDIMLALMVAVADAKTGGTCTGAKIGPFFVTTRPAFTPDTEVVLEFETRRQVVSLAVDVPTA